MNMRSTIAGVNLVGALLVAVLSGVCAPNAQAAAPAAAEDFADSPVALPENPPETA
ncbi:MAG: hypothetical protein GYA73_04605, partial [Planctomycetes bacterium]|nr:hypothetical protein [Planctomycetota bacterium]